MALSQVYYSTRERGISKSTKKQTDWSLSVWNHWASYYVKNLIEKDKQLYEIVETHVKWPRTNKLRSVCVIPTATSHGQIYEDWWKQVAKYAVNRFANVAVFNLGGATDFTFVNVLIIESVDSISRDGLDTP